MAESSRSSGLGGGRRPLWDPVAAADEDEEHLRQIAGGSEARSMWTMEVEEERGIPPPPPPVWRPSLPPPVAAYSAPAGRRRPSVRAPAPISPRSSSGYPPPAFFCDIGRDEEGRHFLDNCTLCRKPLRNRDIYMYKGDVPFCSEECRQEQIDKDEARERTGSMKTSPRKASSSSSSEQKQGVRVPAAGAIVAG